MILALNKCSLSFLAMVFTLSCLSGCSYLKKLKDKYVTKTEQKTGKLRPYESKLEELLEAAGNFRLQALENYQQALASYADSSVLKKFKKLNAALWPTNDPKIGWAFFFNGALICPGTSWAEGAAVAFYHPWSDVFLVTIWNRGKEQKLKISDIEVLMGDFIRKKGKPVFEPSRLWTREDRYRPVAVGIGATESILAFEEIFAGAQGKKQSWRKEIKSLNDPKTLEANYFGAGALLMENFAEMAELLDISKKNDKGAALRPKLGEFMGKAQNGQIEKILKEATETMPAAREAIRKIPPEDWHRFLLTTFIPGEEESLVMLVNGDNPDIYLSLLYTKKRNIFRLQRIDLLSFLVFYKERESFSGGE